MEVFGETHAAPVLAEAGEDVGKNQAREWSSKISSRSGDKNASCGSPAAKPAAPIPFVTPYGRGVQHARQATTKRDA